MSANHSTPTTPTGRDCARMRTLLPLQAHELLGPQDAERLSAHLKTCPRCQAELAAYARLDAALHRTVAAMPAIPLRAEAIMAHVETRTESTSTSLPSAPMREAGTCYRGPRPLTTALAAIAALIVVALFAHLLLSRGPTTPNTGARMGTPEPTASIQHGPSQFSYGSVAGQLMLAPVPASERDPRVVFAHDLRINLCGTEPVRAVSVTWLTTSPTFGLALVEAECGGTRVVAQVSLFSRINGMACRQWSAAANIADRPTDTNPLPSGEASSLPSWLPLPRQSYITQQALASAGEVVEQAYTGWLYADQTYIAGRYEGQAYEPTPASATSVAGNTSWVTVDGAYSIVTIRLAGGQTFFFGGTGGPTRIQQLEAIALAHLDTLLPHVGTPAVPSGFSC